MDTSTFHETFIPDEREGQSMKTLLSIADRFGYGICIAILKRGLINEFMKGGMDEIASAISADDVGAFSQETFDKLTK